MGLHVFLDGLALGVAFSIDEKLGIAVFVALLVHAFSDGLNTVAMLVKTNKWTKKGVWLLGVDSIARISGAAIGSSLALSENITRFIPCSILWNCHLHSNKSHPARGSCQTLITLDISCNPWWSSNYVGIS
ncbi:hypothetical protein EMGBS7_07220 [Candidatus Planktophila sp.]|nr:hypothetical protein EMGBS7_07220 [Candidatus Planktophila sp.]